MYRVISIFSALLGVIISLNAEGISSFNEHTMKMALSACQNRSGLIGPESAGHLQQLMNQNNLTSVWIDLQLENIYSSWRFLDNRPLEDPQAYFETIRSPQGCGTVDTGEDFFEDKNCLLSDNAALCKDCKYCTSQCYFEGKLCYQKDPSSNWFAAKKVCERLGGKLADLNNTDDIPKIPNAEFWTGVHNLNLQELQPLQDILANLSSTTYAVNDIQNGKACLVAEINASLTWRLGPCSDRHPAICRTDKYQYASTTSDMNEPYGYLGTEHGASSGSSGWHAATLKALLWFRLYFIFIRCA